MCLQPEASAALTAAPTSPGALSHVPSPISGIFEPDLKVISRRSPESSEEGMAEANDRGDNTEIVAAAARTARREITFSIGSR